MPASLLLPNTAYRESKVRPKTTAGGCRNDSVTRSSGVAAASAGNGKLRAPVNRVPKKSEASDWAARLGDDSSESNRRLTLAHLYLDGDEGFEAP